MEKPKITKVTKNQIRTFDKIHHNISAGHFHIGTMTGLFMRKATAESGEHHY